MTSRYSKLSSAQLRRHAEDIVLEKIKQLSEGMEPLSLEESMRLLNELQVFQIELEMQNEELRRTQEELEASRVRYFELYDLAPVGYVILNDKGLILETNLTAATLLGVTRGAIVNQPFTRFILPEDKDMHYQQFKQLFEKGEPQTYEIRLLHADGDPFWVHLVTTAATDVNGLPVCRATISDVTDRKQAEEALRESENAARLLAQENELIAEIGRIIGSTLDIEEVYERFAAKVRGAIPFDRLAVNIIDKTEYSHTIRYAKSDILFGGHIGEIFPLAESITEQVVRTKSSAFINSKNLEDTIRKYPGALSLQLGATSIIIIPLISKDEVIGTLAFHSSKTDAYSEKDLLLAERMGLQIAGAIANAQLVKERMQAEDVLRDSESKYRSLASTVDSLVLVDSDCRILFANDNYLDYFGPIRDSILGRKYDELHNEEDSRIFAENVKYVIERGISYQDERKSGRSGRYLLRTFSPVKNIDGTITAVTVVSKNITERKLAEEALRESEMRYRAVAKSANDAIITFTGKGTIMGWNLSAERMFGYPEAEALGQSLALILPQQFRKRNGDDPKQVQTGIEHHLIGKTVELGGLRKDGSEIPLELSLAQWEISGDRYYTGIIRDITDRKRLDKERIALIERLQRSEKMEALGKLAGGVAHDLNNVLGVVSGYSELLMERLPERDPLREYAVKILESSGKAAAIIQDLLTLARRGVAVAKVINLNSIISNFIATSEFNSLQTYHANVSFKTDIEENLLNINGSPIHLEKTVMNLLSNAMEAIVGSGEVKIRTENRYLDKAVRGYDMVHEGDYVVLTVSDNGKGIPAADIDKIFEPFYTKKSMGRSGTGLGLAIVWGTVKDHNGYIDVQSIEGGGSTFTLYFPVTREKMGEEAQKIPVEQYMGRGESVLVVDDVEGQRDVATALLKQLGYQVNTAASGEEAVEFLKSNEADILILDMIMEPGIDGLETYKQIVSFKPKQKAIIVSGFSETDRVDMAKLLGAGAYVKKPYVMEKIGMAIQDELSKN